MFEPSGAPNVSFSKGLEHFWKLDPETVEITLDVEQKLRGDTNEDQAGSTIRKRGIFVGFWTLVKSTYRNR